MADDTDQSEKTEEPTQKRLDDALKKGDVAKSQEVSSWFAMAGIAIVVAMLSPHMAGALGTSLKGYLEHAGTIQVDGGSLEILFWQSGGAFAGALLLPMVLLAVIAVAGSLIQHQMVWSLEPIKPKLSKISPASGFKRLFSRESLFNFAKGVVKIGIVATLMVIVIYPERDRLDTMITADVNAILAILRELVLKLLGAIIAAMTVIAALDFMWQRQRWHEKQKMTLREIKDEYKQTEGDPAVKAKIRQLRNERSRRRMMAKVPEATVVITNPTHFAVALQYERGMNAPLCVAKGTDAVALRIRAVAKEHDVPTIENPPLARTLYAAVDIDEEIPEAQYRAVAEVIGYIMRQKSSKGWRAT
ncbi:flagellar biosynthesis protein FlhB [Rhodobium gokarnense]|uniref:Flagellar biosynthetic protein FlhB n=1 Tax=Rhodobium gokarnense TaxID=364296 RepID=A0ABT3HD57_9HYPH|nr:flagellar biosynthesis protein FlhB [Rhodobium gokarnense]MCW2308340.1 flagellar biosynthetic protein FlhB [Rhodobium gokarnense]